MRSGGCQCGAVRYQYAGEPRALYVCHCAECRKQSASAFGMSLVVPRAGFRVTEGAPEFWTRLADSGRQVKCAFCPDCGSRLWHEREGFSETVTVKAGSLDEPVDVTLAIHIWTSRKLPGVIIPDRALQYPQEPPD
ncbi:MAG: GFA family protein [Parvibaculaceae bacterium]